jgi:hypothetical protein
MTKTYLGGLNAASSSPGLHPLKKKQRKFRDPRLRWMDDLLRSFHGPAPESWVPEPYRYLCRQVKKPSRPTH